MDTKTVLCATFVLEDLRILDCAFSAQMDVIFGL